MAFLKRPHPSPRAGWRSDRIARELLAGIALQEGRLHLPKKKDEPPASWKVRNRGDDKKD